MCPSVTKQYNLVRDSNAVRVKLLSTETAAVCEVFVNIFCPAFLTASITRSQFFLYLISIFCVLLCIIPFYSNALAAFPTGRFGAHVYTVAFCRFIFRFAA